MTVHLVLNQHFIDELLNDPDGAVARDLTRRAINVESQAKLNASGRPGPNVDTGRLRSSITHQLDRRPEGGLVARVGTNVEYARYVEEGTDRAPPYPYLRPALAAARI
jgi:HK97 gp10 family phage protein